MMTMKVALLALLVTVTAQAFGDARLKPLAASDEFTNASSLSQWKVFGEDEGWPVRIEKADVNTTLPGHLFLEPKHGGWWNGFHGSFLYKDVRGDFLVVTRLKVKGRSTPLPDVRWNRAGLLVRKPGDLTVDRTARRENFIHIMTGVDGSKTFVVYTGDSQRSLYQYQAKPDQSQKESVYVELALLKVNNLFIAFYRYNTPGWNLLRKVTRAALADTPLQVGLTACAEPYDEHGVWLNSSYSNYDFDKEILPSAVPVDALAYVDWFRIYDPVLTDEERTAVAEKKFSNNEFVDKMDAWLGVAE